MPAHTDSLLNAVYEELRRLAAYHLGRERPDHSLQATALVYEAYLRLAGQDNSQWQSRTIISAQSSTSQRTHQWRGGSRAGRRVNSGYSEQPTSPDQDRAVSKRFLGSDALSLASASLPSSAALPDRQTITQ